MDQSNMHRKPRLQLCWAFIAALFSSVCQAETDLDISLPNTFSAKGVLIQQNNQQPGCVAGSATKPGNINTALNTCTAKAVLQFNQAERKMYTEYTPCLPLLTAENGGEDTCSYTFINNNIYYVYKNQLMTDQQPTSPDAYQCCEIENFSMLSPSFPDYLTEYNQSCGISPDSVRMHAQRTTLLQTPGNPHGFYGYYSDSDATAPPAIDGHAVPIGFGGLTPDQAFSQVSFTQFDATVRDIEIPQICQAAPACKLKCWQNAQGEITCSKDTLSAFLNKLVTPATGGCEICHTSNVAIPYPGDFPPCPGTQN